MTVAHNFLLRYVPDSNTHIFFSFFSRSRRETKTLFAVFVCLSHKGPATWSQHIELTSHGRNRRGGTAQTLQKMLFSNSDVISSLSCIKTHRDDTCLLWCQFLKASFNNRCLVLQPERIALLKFGVKWACQWLLFLMPPSILCTVWATEMQTA